MVPAEEEARACNVSPGSSSLRSPEPAVLSRCPRCPSCRTMRAAVACGAAKRATTYAWGKQPHTEPNPAPAGTISAEPSTRVARTSGDATAPARRKYRCPSWTLHGHPREPLCFSRRYERAGDWESPARPRELLMGRQLRWAEAAASVGSTISPPRASTPVNRHAAASRLLTFFMFAYLTGVRKQQLARTTVAHVNTSTMTITWSKQETKAKKDHVIHLDGDVLDLVQKLLAHRPPALQVSLPRTPLRAGTRPVAPLRLHRGHQEGVALRCSARRFHGGTRRRLRISQHPPLSRDQSEQRRSARSRCHGNLWPPHPQHLRPLQHRHREAAARRAPCRLALHRAGGDEDHRGAPAARCDRLTHANRLIDPCSSRTHFRYTLPCEERAGIARCEFAADSRCPRQESNLRPPA